MPEVNFSRKFVGTCAQTFKKSWLARYKVLVSPVVALAMSLTLAHPALTVEPATGAPPTDREFSLDPDMSVYAKERGEIENILKSIESQWNAHNLDAVMSYYADEYVNNDGLDKKAVTALTQEFWKTYPDAHSNSKTKQIRVEGNFATIESRDTATGSTAKEMPGIGTKGDLSSVSEGQLYMRKLGNHWRIVGDRIDYEKVRVAFGLAKQLDALFVAPEQVKSGHQYSAKLEVKLPPEFGAVGSITSQPLQYPQITPTDAWRSIDSDRDNNDPQTETHTLERMMPANSSNHNELLMATVGVTNKSKNSLMGITFLTRRLNVVPKSENLPVIAKAKAEEETAPTKAPKKDRDEPKDKGESKPTGEMKDLKNKRDSKERDSKDKDAKDQGNSSRDSDKD